MATIRKMTSKRTGRTTYNVQIRMAGHKPVSKTFPRKKEAERWAQSTETKMREGRYFKTATAERRTVSDLIERYVAEVLPSKPRSQKKQGRQLEWWRSELGDLTLAQLSSSVLSDAVVKLRNDPTPKGTPKAPSTVVRYCAALSHALSYGVQWEWLQENPMKALKKPKEPRGRVRFLSKEERERLLGACEASDNPYLSVVVTLALMTGMRKGEIMNLRWANVDLERRRIILHQTKNGERRAVPIVGAAHDVLSEWWKVCHRDTDLLFPSKVNRSKPMDLRTPWETALRRAEIEDFRFHDLRHTAASYLAMSGASSAEIAEVLGHKTLAMVKRYAHLTEGHTASVLERMGEKFMS